MSIKNKSFELIVGTNEEFLLGYYIFPNTDGTLEIRESFSNHSHNGRIKHVAIIDQFLISGGSDEHVRIFNLYNRKELGYLLPHEGTITCLEFHKSGYFFSAAEDGKIVVFKKGKWEIEKELVGHNSAVNSIAVHPSGKLALSVSRNKRMITWDLVKGKRAYMSGLPKVGEIIKWSPSGQYYIISSGFDLDIYEVETGNICRTFNFKENINCLLFLSDGILAVGVEGGYIYLYNIITYNEILNWGAHSNRVKSLVSLKSSKAVNLMASASSDGYVKVWRIDISSTPSKTLETMIDTKSRIICMAARISPANAFNNSDDVKEFEEEFQQRQDDYHSQQMQKKLENRNKFKKSKTVNKARVVVINEGTSAMKKKPKIKNEILKLTKTNANRRNISLKLKNSGSVSDKLKYKNGKANIKRKNNISEFKKECVNISSKIKIAKKLEVKLVGAKKRNKIDGVLFPAPLKVNIVPRKNRSTILLKNQKKKLKPKKKNCLIK